MSLFQDLQQQIIQELGITANGETAMFYPQNNSVAQSINGIIAPPPFLEEVTPGSLDGVTIIYFFVRLADITPTPALGDTISLNGVSYDVQDVLADSQGAGTLRLRRNS